jgi:peptide-methionine (S)-S-oxide reductase
MVQEGHGVASRRRERHMSRLAHAAAVVVAVGIVCVTAPAAREPAPPTATATFAAGCFWCVEEAFDAVEGVISTTSGYTAGRTTDPTYDEVSAGGTGHTEAVEVVYDPARVSYEQLLQTFWHNVDPLDAGGQFCDRGDQYRSGIYYHSAEQQQAAEASRRRVRERFDRTIATEIEPAGPFYAAEAYHQDYYRKNPLRYRFYKWNCGRARRLEALWGEAGAPPRPGRSDFSETPEAP